MLFRSTTREDWTFLLRIPVFECDLGLTQCQVKEQVAGGRYMGRSCVPLSPFSLLVGGQNFFTLKRLKRLAAQCDYPRQTENRDGVTRDT